MSKVNYIAHAIGKVETRTTPSLAGFKLNVLNVGDVLNISEIEGEWVKHDRDGWSPLFIDDILVIAITDYGTGEVTVVKNPPVTIGASIDGDTIIPYTEIKLAKVAFTGKFKDLVDAPVNANRVTGGLMSNIDKINLDALVAANSDNEEVILTSDVIIMGNGRTLEEYKTVVTAMLADLADNVPTEQLDLTSDNVLMADGHTLEEYKASLTAILDTINTVEYNSLNIKMVNGDTLEYYKSLTTISITNIQNKLNNLTASDVKFTDGNTLEAYKVTTNAAIVDLQTYIAKALTSADVLMADGDTLEEYKTKNEAALLALQSDDVVYNSTNVLMADGDTLEEYKTDVEAKFSGLATNSGVTLNDINVLGITQGAYSDGSVIVAGTSFETIIKNMLSTIIPAIYRSPALTISTDTTLVVETGTTIVPKIIPVFSQNDGGLINSYILKKNGASVHVDSAAVAYTDASFKIGDTTVTYQSTVNYDDGAIKNNNAGNPSPTGAITAGSKTSNTLSYVGKRSLFYGINSNKFVPATSTDVRSLSTKILGATNGTSFDITVLGGSMSVCIAYLATFGDIKQIKSSNMNGDVADVFVKLNINVSDAGAGNVTPYNVYYYNSAIPFPSDDIFEVVI